MLIFEWTLLLLVAAVALAALARRWHAPYPSLLAILGCALVFLPGMPKIVLAPDLALALFVAPVLLDAAYDTSTRDLRDNWRPIAALVVVAVAATTASVAFVAHTLVPDLPWAAAIALGAIVAPPDAAAATAVLRTAPLPHRLRQILEGESLLNDATALLAYRVAVAAAMGTGLSLVKTVPTLFLVAVGSLLAGAALAWGALRVLRNVEDIPTAIVLQFVGTFGVWIVAERVGLSGILTVVAYAIGIARVAPMRTPARIRMPSYAVWATTVFVLNALAFVLIGLQLGPILDRLDAGERRAYAGVAAAVLGTVIATRIVWVMLYNTVVRWKIRHVGSGAKRPFMEPTVQGGAVVSWCGMRGIVTLAAALALPDGEHPFPGRDLILVTAFTVVLGTLVLQGLTLRPLLLWLDLHDDDPVEREAMLARQAALRGALEKAWMATRRQRRRRCAASTSCCGGARSPLPPQTQPRHRRCRNYASRRWRQRAAKSPPCALTAASATTPITASRSNSIAPSSTPRAGPRARCRRGRRAPLARAPQLRKICNVARRPCSNLRDRLGGARRPSSRSAMSSSLVRSLLAAGEVVVIAATPLAAPAQSAPAAVPAASAAAPAPPLGCSSDESRQFDFWVGQWDVYAGAKPDQKVAESVIEKLYQGCAIRENWMPLRGGGNGGSLSAYVAADKGWRQTWVDASGAWADFRGGWRADAMVLQGSWPVPGVPKQITRMTYTVLPDSSVRQAGETSNDDGKTFQPAWSFIYRRAAR